MPLRRAHYLCDMLWWTSQLSSPRAMGMRRRRVLALVQLLLCVLTVGQAARPCPQGFAAMPIPATPHEMAGHEMAGHEMPSDMPAHDMPAHDMPHDAPCTAMPGCSALMPELPEALWQSAERLRVVDAPVGAMLRGSDTDREVEAPPPRG